MDSRHFNSIMGPVNESWTAEVLEMTRNSNSGIDLIGKDFDVEVKFSLIENGYNQKSWKVLGHETAWGKSDRICYWALGFYRLNTRVSNINVKTPKALEKKVLHRELFIVPWDYINQYPVYHQQGKTERSEWNQSLIYPKHKDIPKTILTYPVKGGIVNLTEGVRTGLFTHFNFFKAK